MKTIFITEKYLRQQVIDAAHIFGWKSYFTWNSVHSPRGMPDLILCKPPRVIFAELKTEKGQVSPSQKEWIDLLAECGGNVECYLLRPADVEKFVEILRNDQ